MKAPLKTSVNHADNIDIRVRLRAIGLIHQQQRQARRYAVF
jgi:hypothetical protein